MFNNAIKQFTTVMGVNGYTTVMGVNGYTTVMAVNGYTTVMGVNGYSYKTITFIGSCVENYMSTVISNLNIISHGNRINTKITKSTKVLNN